MNLSSIQVTAYLLRSWHSAWHNACLHNPYPLISHSEDIYSFVILMSHRRKAQFGRVEVTSIPPQMSLPVSIHLMISLSRSSCFRHYNLILQMIISRRKTRWWRNAKFIYVPSVNCPPYNIPTIVYLDEPIRSNTLSHCFILRTEDEYGA